MLYGFVGAFVGYVILFVLANIEPWQFYTIRSTFTGERAMADIVSHPADIWICRALFIITIGGGGLAGLWLARRKNRKAMEHD